MNSKTHKPLSLLSFFIWLAFASLIVSSLAIDFSQDIGSYHQNIIDLYRGENSAGSSLKELWYKYYVRGMLIFSSSAAETITLIKINVVILFLIALRPSMKSHTDAFICVASVCFFPVISENVHEYMRQGLAIALFLIAMGLGKKNLQWSLFVLSILIHQSAIFLMLFYSGGYFFYRFTFDGRGLPKGNYTYIAIALILSVMFFAFVGVPFAKDLSVYIEFLNGQRSNIFGALFLVGYASYLGYRTFFLGTVGYCRTLIAALIICAFYNSIGDLGRALSLVFPFHFHAAMNHHDLRQRYLEVLVILMAGVVVSFGQYI